MRLLTGSVSCGTDINEQRCERVCVGTHLTNCQTLRSNISENPERAGQVKRLWTFEQFELL